MVDVEPSDDDRQYQEHYEKLDKKLLMYGKSDKNKSLDFEDPEDFIQASKGCLENAISFRNLTKIAIELDPYLRSDNAVLTNEALAIELYIKAILLRRGYTPSDFRDLKHKIVDLFEKFPEIEQRAIYTILPSGIHVRSFEEFKSQLNAISGVFVAVRYSYERERMGAEVEFLFWFLEVMHAYANRILRQTQ